MKEFIKDLLNKFVGMNAETRKRTVTAGVVAVLDFLTAFGFINFSTEQTQALLKLVLTITTAFVWAYCSHFKNNDFTEAGVRGTSLTRQIKREQEDGYIGERFFTNQDGDILSLEDFETDEVDGDVMAAEEMAAEALAESGEEVADEDFAVETEEESEDNE